MKAYQDPSGKFDRLRQQAQELIRHTENQDASPPADILELIHELKIHQAELEIQNEELKRAHAEISELQREYKRLYELAPCGYVTLDAQGMITHINLTGVKLLGKPRKHLHHSGLSNYIAEGWQDAYLAVRQKAGQTGENQSVELRLKRQKAPSVWVRADIQADRDDTDAFFQWSVVLVDISAQRKAEQERLRLEDQLRQAQKMETIGTLAGGVAHDINNILAIIIGNYELIKDQLPQKSSLKNNLDEICSASLKARDVVRQLLTFARRDGTQQKPVDLTTVVAAALKLMRSTIPTHIDIHQHLADETCTVLCNSTQINQLIINLCTNAADAMLPEGGLLTVTVEKVTLSKAEAQLTRTLVPGAHIKLVVKDTGRGMDAQTLEHIYEPYFTTKAFGKGTGIGLAIVHGVVQQHKGEIWAESRPGQGTTFTILLPALEGAVAEEEVVDIDLPKGTEKILFVDDEAAMVTLSQSRLATLGYRVTGTTNPLKALEMVKEDPFAFDLVITDMAMPHMPGVALSYELLRLRPDLPIILCTGYSESIDAKSAQKMGISHFMMKPAGIAEIAKTVRETLDEALRKRA